MPFEEDERDPNIWFLDHSYLESMSAMFKKVNGEHCLCLQLLLHLAVCLLLTRDHLFSQGKDPGLL